MCFPIVFHIGSVWFGSLYDKRCIFILISSSFLPSCAHWVIEFWDFVIIDVFRLFCLSFQFDLVLYMTKDGCIRIVLENYFNMLALYNRRHVHSCMLDLPDNMFRLLMIVDIIWFQMRLEICFLVHWKALKDLLLTSY